ncbi:hypothetical protein G7054_g695 [Neopestalotiopsis clavispora]|nr:hypothetical protein G7054_g695 [Neopestalotiopsis clavispora]
MAARSALLAVAALAARAHAQSSGTSDIYSVNQCPPDSNNLEAYNLQLDWSTSSDGKGSEFSGCYSTSIDLPDWPTTDNGKYEVWVDTSSFGEGCSMLFYNLLDSNEESNNWPCRSLYRQVQKSGTPCGDLDLTKEFGFAWPETKKRGVVPKPQKREASPPPAKDVTKIKRAPVFQQKRDDCKVNLQEDPYTTYGEQIKMGDVDTCEKDQTTCGRSYTYSTGTEIMHGTTHEDSTEVGFSEYIVFSNTFSNGWEESTTETTEFSNTKNIAPEPGHSGYPTFQPLFICAKATVEGDCGDVSVNGDTVCMQKYLPNNIPDGHWLMVTTD